MGIAEKIKAIEEEMARTQKNKATEYHIGLLKAKLAKHRSQLIDDASKASGGGGEGFSARKAGDARCSLIGFPSVGKSTLLCAVTNTESRTGAFEYTTMTCIPGVIEYAGSNIQLLDLPGIIEGAAKGIGKGKQVIAVARTSDLIVMMLDASKGSVHKRLLENELESVGIRLNKERPNIYYKPKKTGGLTYCSTVKQSQGVNERLVRDILKQHKIFNADIVFHQDISIDQFIDEVEGNRQYIRCLYVYNKIDTTSIEEVDRLAREPHSVVISCEWKLNLDFLVDQIWEHLDLIRIFTKRRGEQPDFTEPCILRRGSTVEDLCDYIHRDMKKGFKYAMLWGKSAKHSPQRVGITHALADEDVVQLFCAT
eukprot:CAMPEP_0117450108 /NCGR_PEP_ID=MMETSP0759-20121206/8294_1 /TAXON_ID=63605 /ORGANISM="Percolomonas cosmopolitus, Strain WS" /LENGTH=367 /DNA_ID=CAMNT_0005242611 /DNA_START=64 /DNA_END=1167 /DNA_ORIENTATION=-